MKSIVFTFLAICLLSFSAFGQGEVAKKEAYKVDETGEGIGCDWNTRLARLRDEGAFNSEASVVLIIYKGITENPQVYLRQLKSINKEIDFVSIDRAKIKILDGGFREKYTVEFWIVPEGAENPKPMIYFEKIFEFSQINENKWKAKFDDLWTKFPSCEYKIHIYITGQKRTIEKLAMKYLTYNTQRGCHFVPKVVVVTIVGNQKTPKTEFWIVPPKSEK